MTKISCLSLVVLAGSIMFVAPSQVDSQFDNHDTVHNRIWDFYSARPHHLQAHLREPDKTLKLGAYWLYLQNEYPSAQAEHERAADSAKFLGMYEVTTGNVPPDWWKALFGKVDAETDLDEFLLPVEEYDDEGEVINRPGTKLGTLNLAHGLRFIEKDEKVAVCSLNDKTFKILLKDIAIDDYDVLVAALDGLDAYLVKCSDDLMYGFDLMKLNSMGQVVWSCRLPGTGFTGAITGPTFPGHCHIQVVNNQILVYGKSEIGTFVESVSDKDGSVNFHFSTYLASKW